MSITVFFKQLAIVATPWFLALTHTYACNCPERTFWNEVRQTDLIVKGKILKREAINVDAITIDDLRKQIVVNTILVLRIYKGQLRSDTICVMTDKVYENNCAKYLAAGDFCLLYTQYKPGFYGERSERTFTDICTRTTLFALADQEELKLLEELVMLNKANNRLRDRNRMPMIWAILTCLLLTCVVAYIQRNQSTRKNTKV
jgi:hypothetical protein